MLMIPTVLFMSPDRPPRFGTAPISLSVIAGIVNNSLDSQYRIIPPTYLLCGCYSCWDVAISVPTLTFSPPNQNFSKRGL